MSFDINRVISEFASWLIVAVISGSAAFIMRLMRKINTNEKQIAQDRAAHKAQIEVIMLRLDQRDQARDEDRDNVERLGTDVRELRTDIREIKNALINKG